MTKCFNLLQRESDVRQIWTASILLSTAVSSSAVTLGRYSGVALIGRPLDVQVQVLLAPGEDLANQCLSADVFYGDIQVGPGQVSALPRAGATDSEGAVRIQSTLPVNEPIVTLYVRAGCGMAFTRRFVLLADLINEPAVVGAPVVVPQVAPPAAESASGSPSAPPAAAAPTAVPPAPAPAATHQMQPENAPPSVQSHPATPT